MFRIRLKSRSGKFYYYYRCAGRGAQRHGCGNMVDYEATNTIIAVRVFMTSTEPYRTREWVKGTNYDAEIANVKQDIREAAEAERFEDLPELQAKLAELRSRETVKGHYEYQDTGQTVGQHFMSLDNAGKREYLKTRDIRVEKAVPVLEPGATRGVRVVIDGEDHGVWPYPPPSATR
jgi:hypothetical protein